MGEPWAIFWASLGELWANQQPASDQPADRLVEPQRELRG